MSENYRKYSKCLERSVKHIFTNFLGDASVKTVAEACKKADYKVWLEIEGSFCGEIFLKFPDGTMKKITEQLYSDVKGKALKQASMDIMGELANMITGTFANQLQFLNHDLILNAPEFENDPIPMKALYENISLTFESDFGLFEAEVFFRNEEG